MTEKPTLVIGDVHGHLDRLEDLLKQEGIIEPCSACGSNNYLEHACSVCDDQRYVRRNHDVSVVQLGDLGHFGGSGGSPSGDYLCFARADDGWIDIVLWGNHDRALVDGRHAFYGYEMPQGANDVMPILGRMERHGKLRMAYAAHGHLITHAGLHKQFKHQKVGIDKTDPYAVADFINSEVAKKGSPERALWDAISRTRGGPSPYGGILWRDANESLYEELPQIFGHTSKPKIRRYGRNNESICIDVGAKHGNRLAGIWLPEKRIVTVGEPVEGVEA